MGASGAGAISSVAQCGVVGRDRKSKSEMSNNRNNESYHSVLREQIVEHAFVTELLKSLWRKEMRNIDAS